MKLRILTADRKVIVLDDVAELVIFTPEEDPVGCATEDAGAVSISHALDRRFKSDLDKIGLAAPEIEVLGR